MDEGMEQGWEARSRLIQANPAPVELVAEVFGFASFLACRQDLPLKARRLAILPLRCFIGGFLVYCS